MVPKVERVSDTRCSFSIAVKQLEKIFYFTSKTFKCVQYLFLKAVKTYTKVKSICSDLKMVIVILPRKLYQNELSSMEFALCLDWVWYL